MTALSSFLCYLQVKLKEVFLFFAFDEGERLRFVYHTWSSILYAVQFNGLDAILDRPGTFCLDLMCLVFLTRELVSILWHSF